MSLTYKLSDYNRKKKWEMFLDMIKPSASTTILDAGFTEDEYSNVENYIERYYSYPHNITALGTDTPKNFLEHYPEVRTIQYDGKIFPFDNDEFDICWSNAVIEHVGDRESQAFFLKEINRVSKRAFITTPNRYYPIEVHTRTPLLHLLPKGIFDKFLRFAGKGWATGDYMNLLSLNDLKSSLKKAGIFKYRIIKNRLLFTIDFIVIF